MHNRAQLGPEPIIPMFLTGAVVIGIVLAELYQRVSLPVAVVAGGAGIVGTLAVVAAAQRAYAEVTE